MRLQYTVVVLLIAVVGTTTMPVTGQEEPLPVIQAKSTLEPPALSIALAVDPIRDLAPRMTLAGAARANDYATFDALYRDAVQRGERVGGFAALHELWTFSMTDPIGAFYGQETYERFARAYPGFARYIEDYRIVDRNGNAFYPTSETRTFLLDRAVEGPAPRVQIAERNTRSTQPSQRNASSAPQRAGTPASPPAGRAASRRPVPAKTTTPTQATTRDAVGPAGEDAGVPAKAPVAVAETAAPPVVVAETPAAPPVEEPVVIKPSEPTTVAVDNQFGTRGIFLLLVGIFGIGILAMMLRAPRELPASIMTPPAEPTAPPVEPIRRPSAAPLPPQPPPTEKNRASGSHG